MSVIKEIFDGISGLNADEKQCRAYLASSLKKVLENIGRYNDGSLASGTDINLALSEIEKEMKP